METVNWKVEGMSCSNCVLTIDKYLQKKGLENIKLNLAGGELSFDIRDNLNKLDIEKGIESLGYSVITDQANTGGGKKSGKLNPHLRYLLICLPFTLVLMLHMAHGWLGWHWLMNPWLQLILCLPVYITGMYYFGRSAYMSIRNGMPNMNVLIALGASAAFLYSLTGTLLQLGPSYLFYETAAAIITLVFLGYYIEDLSIHSTQRALDKLARSQKVMAQMIAFDENHQEIIFPVENIQLRSGDLILIRSGEQVPADAKILSGEASVNESLLTGESLPLYKKPKDMLLGGSVVIDGNLKAQVTASAQDSMLAGIINLVKRAQGDKPPMQLLADRISAIFVPVVLGIAALTFILNYLYLHDITASLMRSIAVLVIACPCAMGLATPAAIAVGLGRAARNGILIRNSKSLEAFREIRQIVFDKTGTLTTGKFQIRDWKLISAEIAEQEFKHICFSLEKYSTHPIAQSISAAWKSGAPVRWNKIEEIKGVGIKGTSMDGQEWQAGSYEMAKALTTEDGHNVYIIRNGKLAGWIDISDEIRPEAESVIGFLKRKQIRTILLSGDRQASCKEIAGKLGIDAFYAEQSPAQKLAVVKSLNQQSPTAMVGDGINDAPALAEARLGISLSDAAHISIQTADVVLLGTGLKNLPLALKLGKYTYQTIKQNLFWAFFYNVIAIPVAAFGFLSPALGALVMGFSDVVLAVNSLRLYGRRL